MKKFLGSAVVAALCPLLQTSSQGALISSVYTGLAGTYTLTGTVTSVLNLGTTNTFTFADGSGSVIAYGIPLADYTATVGDNITGTFVNSPYQGAPELTSTGLTAPGGANPITINSLLNAVSPTVLTIPQFVAAGNGSTTAIAPNAEAIVTLKDVFLPAGTTTIATKTTYKITDGSGNSTNMYTYTSDSAVATGVTAANLSNTASLGSLYSGAVDITGYVDVYYGVPEIYPTSITATVPEPASVTLIGFIGGALVRRRRRA